MVSYRSELKALAARASALDEELAELHQRTEAEERRAADARRKSEANASGCSGWGAVMTLVVAPWLAPMVFFAITTLEARGSLDEKTTWRVTASTHAGISTRDSCATAIVRRGLRSECRATLTCGTVSATQLGSCAERDLTLVYWSNAHGPARAILSQRAARGMWKTEDGVILLERRTAP